MLTSVHLSWISPARADLRVHALHHVQLRPDCERDEQTVGCCNGTGHGPSSALRTSGTGQQLSRRMCMWSAAVEPGGRLKSLTFLFFSVELEWTSYVGAHPIVGRSGRDHGPSDSGSLFFFNRKGEPRNTRNRDPSLCRLSLCEENLERHC